MNIINYSVSIYTSIRSPTDSWKVESDVNDGGTHVSRGIPPSSELLISLLMWILFEL